MFARDGSRPARAPDSRRASAGGTPGALGERPRIAPTLPLTVQTLSRLQSVAGNQAASIVVQRQPNAGVKPMQRQAEGKPAPPRSVEEAIDRRRLQEFDPNALDHWTFAEWLETTEMSSEVKGVFHRWSWDRHIKSMFRWGEIRSKQLGHYKGGTFGVFTKRRDEKGPPPRQPGWWTKSLAVGAFDYAVGLGKGVVHGGRYGVAFTKAAIFGDEGDLRSLLADDAAFLMLIGSLLANPIDTAAKVAAGYTAIVASERYLTKDEVEKIKTSIVSNLPETAWKMVGKHLVKKAAISAITPIIAARIGPLVTNELIRRGAAKAKGAPLMILSVLGMMEDARAASLRLKAKYPSLYAHLQQDNLHMAWVLVEPHEAEIRAEITEQLDQGALPVGRSR